MTMIGRTDGTQRAVSRRVRYTRRQSYKILLFVIHFTDYTVGLGAAASGVAFRSAAAPAARPRGAISDLDSRPASDALTVHVAP